jgi:DNA-directed RNA polymerase specialized sigma24 family protein
VSFGGSITHWIQEIRKGDPVAAQVLWDRYFPELVHLAREKLRGVPRRVADEEDVALSALDSFYRAAQEGRFGELADRNELLRLLLRMTARKAVDLVRRETSQRRGGGQVRGDSGLCETESAAGEHPLADRARTPELAATVADECRRLLNQLDPDLQALALAKMEGYTNEEIAERFQCSTRTVERRLHLIREIWERQ